jgi:peroxiredoxin
MKMLFTYILILHSFSLLAQDCFEKCNENLKNSKLPFPDANEEVISKLKGCRAPQFDVTSLTGERLKLSALKGKVVVINFWYRFCPPCVAEIPALNNLVRDYAERDVVFIAFAKDSRESLKTFLASKKFDYKIVSGEYDLTDKYCLMSGSPMNLVLDRNGVVQEIFSGGYVDERAQTYAYDRLSSVIESCLSKDTTR